MAKKSDKLTKRQRESQRIMREKDARKRRQLWIRRAQITACALLACLLLSGGFWVWKTSMVSRALQAMSDGMYNLTAQAGFSVDSLHLEGRNRTSAEDINKVMALKKGDPILRLPLDELRHRLEAIGSVRMAAVERELPNRLIVRIIEREPVAIWQQGGKLVLVDDNGVAMPDIDVGAHRALPLIVGEDAPLHVREILELLALDQTIGDRFAAAVRISGRRWNIHLRDGTQVKLPEHDPALAWEKLAQIHAKQQLLDRDVHIIDLRVAGRLFIKMPPQEPGEKTSTAKET